jgi:hypothetical protein
MSIKLALLKSGEDVISDIQEMVVDNRVVGYFFNKPYSSQLNNINSENDKTLADISLRPWIPLSSDKKIPVTTDWIITIVEPVESLKNMYMKVVENND